MAAPQTYTIAEAAELTGLSKKAMRHRVDRGQLQAIKDGHLRRISRTELERAGLRVAAQLARDDAPAAIRERLAESERELSQARERLEAERALRIEAEASAKRAWAARAAERDWRDELMTVSPQERGRLVREAQEDAPEEVFFSSLDSSPAHNGEPRRT